MSKMPQLKDYTVLEEIGEGSFAKVYKAKKQTGALFALKEIKKRNSEFQKYIQGELDIVKQKLKHNNIVEIYEYFIEKNIYIAMEFCKNGDLNSYLIKQKPDLILRISFMQDMALGVMYLHSQNIVHRDLKPENILVTNQPGQIICKITDFGVSRIKLSKYDKFQTYIGSYPYMAPEVTGDKEYSHEVDTFALGLLFYAVFKNSILTNSFGESSLIAGIHVSTNRIAYLNEVLKREKPNEETFLNTYFQDSMMVGKLIFSMVHTEPEKRPEMENVVMHIKVIQELGSAIERQSQSVKDSLQRNEDMSNTLSQLQVQLEAERLEHNEHSVQMNKTIQEKKENIAELQKLVEKLLSKQEVMNVEYQDLKLKISGLKKQNKKEKKKMKDELNQKEAVITNLQTELESLRDQHQNNQKIVEQLQNTVTQKEVTNQNMQKQNNFQMKELRSSHERYEKERKSWHQKDKENQKVIGDLQQKNILMEEEMIEATKVNQAENLKFQKDAKKKGEKERESWHQKDKENQRVIGDLQQKNISMEEEMIEATKVHQAENLKFQKDAKERNSIIDILQLQIKALQDESEKKSQIIASLRDELEEKDRSILSMRQEIISNEQEIMSLKEQLNEQSQNVIHLRKECESCKQFYHIEIEMFKAEIEGKEALITGKENQHKDEKELMETNIQKIEMRIQDNGKVIEKLYQHIDELQQMLHLGSKETVPSNSVLIVSGTSSVEPPNKQVNVKNTEDKTDKEKNEAGPIVKNDCLEPPLMKLDLMAVNPELGSVFEILPLSDGSYLINSYKNNKESITLLSDTGQTIRKLFTGKSIHGFIPLPPDDVLILQLDGTMTRVQIQDGNMTKQYKTDVGRLWNGIHLEEDKLLLVDYRKGELINYRMSNGHKEVVIKNLNQPTSVDRILLNQGCLYIVCVGGSHCVNIYNSDWSLMTSIGGRGADDGNLKSPQSAIVLPDNTVIIADMDNHRVSQFNINGDFLCNILNVTDGIKNPRRLSFKHPYLYLSYGPFPFNVKCFQIYK